MINIKKLQFKIYIYMLWLYKLIISYYAFIFDLYKKLTEMNKIETVKINRFKLCHLNAKQHHERFPFLPYKQCLKLAFDNKLKYQTQ